MSDRLLLRGVPTNGLAWWSLTSLPWERSRLKPRSLRISREINVPWTCSCHSWAGVVPMFFLTNLLRDHFWASLKRWRIVEVCVFASWFTNFGSSAETCHIGTLGSYPPIAGFFLSGSSIGILLKSPWLGNFQTDVGSLSIRVPYDEMLAASADRWLEMVNIDGYPMDTN